mmetsp:Transcript_59891/g.110927  ORF Transcript_59891/g.110927 Transcript_59891/m.110927 type:complete len:181 (-) Transcript_59891:128-670(-)
MSAPGWARCNAGLCRACEAKDDISRKQPSEPTQVLSTRQSEKLEPDLIADFEAAEAFSCKDADVEPDFTEYGKISSFAVDLDLRRQSLGAKLANGLSGDVGKLCITDVHATGALAEWNRKHPGMEVDRDCIILELNGTSVMELSNEEVMKQLRTRGPLKLYVRRVEMAEYRPNEKRLYGL